MCVHEEPGYSLGSDGLAIEISASFPADTGGKHCCLARWPVQTSAKNLNLQDAYLGLEGEMGNYISVGEPLDPAGKTREI